MDSKHTKILMKLQKNQPKNFENLNEKNLLTKVYDF
jgi:hypothetical protein